MNHILRDIKLSKLTDTPMSDEASKLVKFWDELWCDMKVHIDANKGEIKCWKDGYKYYYFAQDDKNGSLWCDYYKVWLFFEEELGLDYSEIQGLIQYMVDKTLNCGVNTPLPVYLFSLLKVDKTLNCGVNTPGKGIYSPRYLVDKTLKCYVNDQ